MRYHCIQLCNQLIKKPLRRAIAHQWIALQIDRASNPRPIGQILRNVLQPIVAKVKLNTKQKVK